ncbi:MAG: hypothetical protein KDA44_16870 [Planctomycetales bacterium]|nr:hypothetical protein [Planctomycetales bacterium]
MWRLLSEAQSSSWLSWRLLTSEYFFISAAVFATLTLLVLAWMGFRYIPHHSVGVVEKLWSLAGSVDDGQMIALDGQAGFQAELLRGGVHFGYWRWQYRVHKRPLATIPQGQLGYVFARDGEPMQPSQTLGRVVRCDNFQDAREFLRGDIGQPLGQRGRQRAILREGVYAVNPALFVVITEEELLSLPAVMSDHESVAMEQYRRELTKLGGFRPVVIGGPPARRAADDGELHDAGDEIGIVTVHDGPSLSPDEIIAPIVGTDPQQGDYHNNFQDAEAFLRAGGRRGRQYQVLTDGTYFLNRWFATLEKIPKTVVPIGSVGVVVSYVGRHGNDVSGQGFRHGEQVQTGDRGVWDTPLGPGKYAFNTYAGSLVAVPTTNFVLHWVTGKTESHRFDESLRSIDLVTRDAYEPLLPLSVVVHIDYQRAPSVIQRFGDVKKLITQTLDPMLSAYFRDVAHTKTMLELLHDRDAIQHEAREELRRKFHMFDIECVDVLIGKPTNAEGDGHIETLLEQLRLRQLSREQIETFEHRKEAAQKLQELNDAQAHADMQTTLTQAKVQAAIAENEGAADLARARKQAEQTVVVAEASLERSRREAQQKIVLAEADARERKLAGQGESARVMQTGVAEAAVLLQKIQAFGDPRLFALAEAADRLSRSAQPLVPDRLFVSGGESEGDAAGSGMWSQLLRLMVAEKSGFAPHSESAPPALQQLGERMTRETLQRLEEAETGPTGDE